MSGLIRDQRGAVSWLQLDRPDRGNAFTRALQRDLVEAFADASHDQATRVVVLTASGRRHFCTGPDLGDPEMTPSSSRIVGEASSILRAGSQRVVSAMLDCEKPIICGLNGTAAGGGANLVLAADLIVAADDARLIELFVTRGLIPDGGAAYLLSRHLPRNVVKRLILFGEELGAHEAHRLGLVNEVVTPDLLDDVVAAWASRLAAGPTRALVACKQLLNTAVDQERHDAFALEAALVEQVARTDDVAEGVAAFLERRRPRFEGR